MTSAVSGPSCAADGIEFIYKNNAGSLFATLFKKVPDPARAYSYKHLHKVGTGHVKKRNPGLPCNRLRQKGLAGTRHSHQKNALWNLGADFGEFRGILQKIHNFLKFKLGLGLSGDIRKSGLIIFFEILLCLAFPEGKCLITSALDLSEHEPEKEQEEQPRNQLQNNPSCGYGLLTSGNFHTFFLQDGKKVVVKIGNNGDKDRRLTGISTQCSVDFAVVENLDRVNLSFIQIIQKHRIRDFRFAASRIHHEKEYEHDNKRKEKKKGETVLVEVKFQFVRIVIILVWLLIFGAHLNSPS